MIVDTILTLIYKLTIVFIMAQFHVFQLQCKFKKQLYSTD